MLELKLDARQSRNWFSKGYRTHVDARLSLPVELGPNYPTVPIALLLERIFKYCPLIVLKITQAEVTDESGRSVHLIENLRGRPKETFHNGFSRSAAKSEELFYADGVIFEPPENLDDYPESVEQLKQVPFNYSIESSFHSFSGSKRIAHTVASARTDNIFPAFEPFDLSALFRMIPAKVLRTRIGLEQYQPTWLGSAFGPALAIQQRFYLEVAEREILIFAEVAFNGDRGSLPFASEALLPAVDRSLQELDLFCGLSRQIAAKLS